MEKIRNYVYELRPLMFMVTVQVVFAGGNVLYKLAANDGMSLRVIVAYRFVFATVFMVPLALIVKRERPKLTWTVLLQAFLCGLLGGSLSQNLYLESMALTSATFASAIYNLVPAVTFVLAVAFRMEKLCLNTMSGKAKVLGTLIGLGGAMLFTFYKASLNRALGALAALGSCTAYALWLIVQTKMSEKYPCHYTSTALTCVMGAIQSVAYALCTEKDWSQWRLGWNVRLLTVAYAGILSSGLMYMLILLCVRMRGPLYASIFNPLLLVLVAFAGSLFLEEKLYLGSVLGAVLIVLGLYIVLWGKGKELKKMTQSMPSTSPQITEPSEIIVTSPTCLKGLSEGLEEKEANSRRDGIEEKEVMDIENASN
ncbi:hypothetical protein SLA2020_159800 [Shorea laevis]